MKEGYDPKQAAAIAYRNAGRSRKKGGEKMAEEHQDEREHAKEERYEKGKEEKRIPHGAQHLADIHSCLAMTKEYIEGERPVVDHDGVRKIAEETHAALGKSMGKIEEGFARHYPDMEGLGESKDEEETAKEAEEDEDLETETPAEDETGEHEREAEEEEEAPKSLTGKRHIVRHRTAEAQTKRLNRSQFAACKDAADFLHDHAEHPALDHTAKAACRYHAKALSEVARSADRDEEEETDEAEAKAVMDFVTKALPRIERVEKELKQAIGA